MILQAPSTDGAAATAAGSWSAVGAQAVAAMTKTQRAIRAPGTFISHLRAGGTVCCYFSVSSVGKAAGGVYSSPTYRLGLLLYEDEIRSVEGPVARRGGPEGTGGSLKIEAQPTWRPDPAP